MSDWQERITRDTAPSIRVEHELRYRAAAPMILGSGAWADLGCGNGLAAAAALGASRPAHAVLVDLDAAVVATAARELQLEHATQLAVDLTDAGALEQVGAALLDYGGEPFVSCFEVVEHLSSFIPLIEWAGALAREHAATFLISVPNDAFWSIENPHHLTSWSEGAFEELRQLLPAPHTLLRQASLTGSVLLDWDGAPAEHHLAVDAGGEAAVATHLLAAFGPRHDEVWRGALAAQADQLGQRRWERERESNIILAEQMASERKAAFEDQERIIVEQREQLRANTREFEDWRTYIQELERELGRPLSGTTREDAPA